MQRLLPILLLAAGAAAGSATAQPADRRFDVRGFDAVDLASSDAVRIVPGAGFAVRADGDPRAVAALAVEVRGRTLRIARRPGVYGDRGATVSVTMPALRAMRLSGSGAMDARGFGGESVTAQLSGSGNLRLPDLRAREVRLILDGSGSIKASGRAERVSIDLGGSGEVEAAALATRALAVDLGGSGSVSAAASGAASIRAGGSGSVRVAGHPTCAVRNSGTANIICG